MQERKTEIQQFGNKIRDSIREGVLDAVKNDREERALEDLKRRLTLSLCFVVPLFLIDWLAAGSLGAMMVEILLTALLVAVNRSCFTDGFESIRARRPEKNTLAAIGSIVALLMFQFATAGLFLTTMALCRCCEAYVRYKLDEHLKRLIEAEPEDPGLETGAVITVEIGEVVPADGTITAGETVIEEELITGERVPADKSAGMQVYAGSKNLASGFEMRVTSTGQDTVISRIIEHITASIATEAPIARRAERAARIFVVAVILLALFMAFLWAASGIGWDDGIMTAVTILIIASPYMFSVGVPMSVLAATVRGAKNGILIRSADILELARDINTIALNKTGTVTEGIPEISDVISIAEGFNLRFAGGLERGSRHPFGQLIFQTALEQYGDLPEVARREAFPGRGVRGEIDGKVYFCGNAALMREQGISLDLPEVDPLFRQGKSVVFFASQQRVIGVVAMRDAPNPVSLKAISRIEGMGIDTVMLTGDSFLTAEAIRNEVGIDQIVAEIRPSEKAEAIRVLRAHEQKVVAMVGNGRDDAEAIAAADIGIAIGSGPEIRSMNEPDEGGPAFAQTAPDGSPEDNRTPDVILIANDMMDVVRAISLSRKTIRIIKQNLVFAYCYNIIAIAAAASILVPLAGPALAPVIASLCMCASQIGVVVSTMRIKITRI